MEIPITNRGGEVIAHTKVDPEDYERFSGQKWSLQATGYPQGWDGKNVRTLHRMILELPVGDRRYVDHINGDKLDNRRENLSVGTQGENMQNLRAAKSHNRTGVLNVHKHRGGYVVRVKGYYGAAMDLEDAKQMAVEARMERYGETLEEAFPRIYQGQ